MNSTLAYNIFFDIAAILNLIIVLFAYLIHKKLPEPKNKMFMHLCVMTLVSAVVDTVSALELSGVFNAPVYGVWIINLLYYFCVCGIPFLFSVYTLTLAEEYDRLQEKKLKLLILIPAIIEFVSILITPFNGFVFEISASGEYIRRSGIFLLYGIMLYQILIGLFLIFYFESKTTVQSKIYICSFVTLTLLGVVIQFLYPTLLIQHFTVSLSLLLFYTSLQINEIVVDSVTGLLNYKAFNVLTHVAFKRKESFTAISVHVEDIQFLNTTFGIDGVNVLLAQISEFLQTLDKKAKVFQIELDTFLLEIPESSSDTIHELTGRISARFTEAWKNAIIEMKISVRQCVIRCPEDAENTETIIDTINSAISDNRYKSEKILYSEKIDVSTKKRYTYIEQLVKTAIQEHRIQVMYQPLFSTAEQKIVGAEALVRMTDHEGNFISPDEFVPIAEQDGFILRIGLYVYEEVCRFLATSHLKNLGIHMIDVNLSVAQCMQTRICEEFEEILKSYNLDPSLINLEITETAAAHTPELLYKNMDNFNRLGFACSLDDYGTGYANLSYMLHMPFSMIKIDKEIIWSAMKDVKAYVMLVGIIDMIHKLNMRTVAEGIETKEMVEKLTELKCDYLQGYYYSKAVPEEVFYQMIKKQADEMGVPDTSYSDVFPRELYPENQSPDGLVEDLEEVDDLEEIE
ncbi:MAG: EAL domain-containing protein [Treponema sp.]|nr:EAL domain-containing protein [Treponema sp.]